MARRFPGIDLPRILDPTGYDDPRLFPEVFRRNLLAIDQNLRELLRREKSTLDTEEELQAFIDELELAIAAAEAALAAAQAAIAALEDAIDGILPIDLADTDEVTGVLQPNNGGTGKNVAALAGQAGKALIANDDEDGFDFGASAETTAGASVTDSAMVDATTTPTAITWNTEVFDDAGFFDSGSSTRFTIPAGMGGLYLIHATCRGNNLTSTHRLSLQIRLNGLTDIEPVGYQQKSDGPANVGTQVRSTVLVRLDADDYVEAVLSANTTVDMLDSNNGFWICRLGGPAVVAGTFEGGGSGTSFPDDPTTGMIWRRTDRNITYVWDGTRWLSAEPYYHPMSISDALQNTTAAGSVTRLRTNLPTIEWDCYVERAELFAYVASTNDGTRYYDFQLRSLSTAGATTNYTPTATTQSLAPDTRLRLAMAAINTVVPANTADFLLVATRVGTTPGSLFVTCTIKYWLIG